MERPHHPWACNSKVLVPTSPLIFRSPRSPYVSLTLTGFVANITLPFQGLVKSHLSACSSCSQQPKVKQIARRKSLESMPGYYDYDDDNFYSSECCIGCCRVGDFGTHDGCGPCYCRRSFKPDYDRTVYTGWSLGQYYPGRDENAGSSSAVIHEEPELPEKNNSSKEKIPEQGINKSDKTSKGNNKPKVEKSKSSNTSSKNTQQK
ncbi:hypothetical protein ACHAPJ_002909 [Fusarium lateritium]